jgi:hypothetical protein
MNTRHGGVLAGRAMFLGSPKNKEENNGAGVSVLHAFPVSWKEDEASKRVQGAEMNTRHGGVLAGRAMFLGSPKNKEENNGAGVSVLRAFPVSWKEDEASKKVQGAETNTRRSGVHVYGEYKGPLLRVETGIDVVERCRKR